MMGSDERSVSICPTTLRLSRRLMALNEIASPIVPAGTIRFTPAGEVWPAPAGMSPSHGGRYRRFAEAEQGLFPPHRVQDDRQLSGDRHAGTGHAATLGYLQAPGTQARPFARAHQQGMGSLVERGAGEFIATAADLTLGVGLARLVAGWCEAEMRAHIPRTAEALGSVKGGAEGECGDGTDTWHAHQPSADRLAAHDEEDLPAELIELLQHGTQHRQERLDEGPDLRVVAGEFPHASGKGCAGWRAELDPALAQDGPHHVLDRAHLVEHGSARHQER